MWREFAEVVGVSKAATSLRFDTYYVKALTAGSLTSRKHGNLISIRPSLLDEQISELEEDAVVERKRRCCYVVEETVTFKNQRMIAAEGHSWYPRTSFFPLAVHQCRRRLW